MIVLHVEKAENKDFVIKLQKKVNPESLINVTSLVSVRYLVTGCHVQAT